ncbi:antibiotic biosynthesis monooxygenase (ABM) superfamily enzyme [Microbacterium sp. ZKA21]|uniref:hypothetical protein n=1 Tax=Microbacterium sp. ZKA21 TaxID=3381694 RepID=UPI003D2508B2
MSAPTAPVSVHVRALITWIAIFPLVTIGLYALAPLTEGWPVALRALVLTLVVVPLSVYVVVPQLLRAWIAVSVKATAARATAERATAASE